MKRLLTFLVMLGLTFSLLTAQAADGHGKVFNKNEVALSLYGGISDAESVDSSDFQGDVTSSSVSDSDTEWGLGVALSAYPFQRYAGVQLNGAIDDMEGTLFDSLEVNGILRLPLDKRSIAPYVIGGAEFEFDSEEWVFGVGPGIEYRMNEKWGVFGEYRYNFASEVSDDRDDEQEVRAGLRLVF